MSVSVDATEVSQRAGQTAPGSPAVPVRLMVVDDHEVVRAGIETLLARESGIKIVGSFGSGEEALQALDEGKPDVVLLDYRLPGVSGAATCREILKRRPETAVVILTTYMDDDVIHACIVAGARGYVLKDAQKSDLAHTVRAAARGESILASEVTKRVLEWARRAKAIHQGGDPLAPHEVEILSLVAKGMSNREIGDKLHTSEHSVKVHLRAIMRKLGAARREEAVAIAIRRGAI